MEIGSILSSRYIIKDILGEGGGGEVYKALDQNTDRNVAVKRIKSVSNSDFDKREIKIMRNIKSEYLPIFYDYFVEDSGVYSVMEFIDGHDIRYLMHQKRVFEENAVVKYALQLCDAVSVLHKNNVIHADIKPSNVLITSADKVCLIDFNISTVQKGGYTSVLGATEEFAAPEQKEAVRNRKLLLQDSSINIPDNSDDTTVVMTDWDDSERLNASDIRSMPSEAEIANMAKIDRRVDIYGIAAVMYYMVTGGKVPRFGAEGLADTKISRKLKDTILIGLNASPDERFDDVQQFKEALNGKAISGKRPGGKKKSTVSVIKIVAPSLVVIMIGLISYYVIDNRPKPTPIDGYGTETTIATSETTKMETTSATTVTTKTETAATTPVTTKTDTTAATPETTKTDTTAATPETTKTETTAATPETTKAETTAATPETTKTETTVATPETTKTETTVATTVTTKTDTTSNENEVIIKGKSYSINTTELHLRNAGLTNADFKEIVKLKKLSVLEISENNISDLSPLKNSGLNLQTFNANNCGITDISALESQKNLEYLSVGNYGYDGLLNKKSPTNNIKDISALSSLKKLKGLWIGGNSITDISALSGITYISDLYLGYNNISDFSPLKNCTIGTAHFEGNNNIGDSFIESFEGITIKNEVYLYDMGITEQEAQYICDRLMNGTFTYYY